MGRVLLLLAVAIVIMAGPIYGHGDLVRYGTARRAGDSWRCIDGVSKTRFYKHYERASLYTTRARDRVATCDQSDDACNERYFHHPDVDLVEIVGFNNVYWSTEWEETCAVEYID